MVEIQPAKLHATPPVHGEGSWADYVLFDLCGPLDLAVAQAVLHRRAVAAVGPSDEARAGVVSHLSWERAWQVSDQLREGLSTGSILRLTRQLPLLPATTDPVDEVGRSTWMPPADFQVLVGVDGDDTGVRAFLAALPWVRPAAEPEAEPLPNARLVADKILEFEAEVASPAPAAESSANASRDRHPWTGT